MTFVSHSIIFVFVRFGFGFVIFIFYYISILSTFRIVNISRESLI